MVKRFIIVVSIAVLVAVGAFFMVKAISAKRQTGGEVEKISRAVRVEAVERRDVVRTFVVTGSVEADAESNVTSKAAGKISRVLVTEGDYVRRGQALVKLENADITAQLRQAEAGVKAAEARLNQATANTGLQKTETSTSITAAKAGLASAKARLQQAEESATMAKSQTDSNVEQAKEGLRAAQAQLDMAIEGSRTQQIAQANEAVASAKASLTNARIELQRAERLLAQGAVSQQSYDTAKMQYDLAQAQYNTATQQADLVKTGSRSQEIVVARAQVEQARAAVSIAEANRAQYKMSQHDVESAREAVRQAEASLELAKASTTQNYVSEEEVQAMRATLRQAQASAAYLRTQLSYTTIHAPMNGVITKRWVDPGEAASLGTTLVTITDNTALFVRGNLPEMEMRKVEVGAQVSVAVDALPGLEISGDIIEIIPSADLTSRTFDMKVRIESQGQVKQGMFARVSVETDRVANGLVIPKAAVLTRSDEKLVYVADNGKARAVAVKTGLTDEDSVVVTEGLAEGEQVIVAGQSLLSDGDAVKPVDGEDEGAGK